MEDRVQYLERQLAIAQRQVRLLFALAVAVPLGFVAWLSLRSDAVAAQPEGPDKKRTVLKAPFDVVGVDGKRLMTVEEKKDGGAQVWFYRPGNEVNGIIDCTPAGGSFSLHSPDGKAGLSLDSLRDGGSFYIFTPPAKAEAERQGVLLWATSSQGTKMRLRDTSGPGHGVKLSVADKDGVVVFAKP
jgi:hypothetical protein